jgi:beta-xylosidase
MKIRIVFTFVLCLLILIPSCTSTEVPPTDTLPPPTLTPIPPTPTNTLVPTSTPTQIPPTPTPTLTPFPPFRDDFNQVLEEGWAWIRESRFGWNLHEKPGFLRIEVELDTNQVLVRHAPEDDFEISTRVLFTPFSNFQSAGLIILQDDEHFLSFHRGMCDYIEIVPEACQGNAIYFNHIDHDVGVPEEGYSIGPQYPTRTIEISEAYLRLTREGRIYTAYYSDDGETWVIIGRQESDLFPFYVGIHTFGAETYLAEADFDYFTLDTIP